MPTVLRADGDTGHDSPVRSSPRAPTSLWLLAPDTPAGLCQNGPSAGAARLAGQLLRAPAWLTSAPPERPPATIGRTPEIARAAARCIQLQAPATCRVRTLSRLKTLVVAIDSSSAASPSSS